MSQQQPIRPLSPLARPGATARPPRKTRLVALGSPIQWSERDLAALADISPADLKAAEALWQRDAPAALKPLLQAQVIEPGEEQ